MFALTPFYRRSVGGNYDPFRELERVERRLLGAVSVPDFRVDLWEEKDCFMLEAELPGFSREGISVEIEGAYMTVRAERVVNREKNEDTNALHSERSTGILERSFSLSGVNVDEISASYENGLLTVKMPKKAVDTPYKRRLTID
jgi:HSP20 family protein